MRIQSWGWRLPSNRQLGTELEVPLTPRGARAFQPAASLLPPVRQQLFQHPRPPGPGCG